MLLGDRQRAATYYEQYVRDYTAPNPVSTETLKPYRDRLPTWWPENRELMGGESSRPGRQRPRSTPSPSAASAFFWIVFRGFS